MADIKTRPATTEYRDGYDRIFGKIRIKTAAPGQWIEAVTWIAPNGDRYSVLDGDTFMDAGCKKYTQADLYAKYMPR